MWPACKIMGYSRDGFSTGMTNQTPVRDSAVGWRRGSYTAPRLYSTDSSRPLCVDSGLPPRFLRS